MYFENIKNKKELLKAYHQAAKKLHPDNSGNAEEFKKMKEAFDRLLKTLPDEGVTGENKKAEIPPEMSAVLEKIIHLDGIDIEICGSWIWVSGSTYPVKDTIKAAGFKFSGNKKMWYWHAGEYHRRSRKSLDMDEIRDRHGSVSIQKKEKIAIA